MNDILDDEIAFKDIELKIISLNMFQNTNFLSKVIGYLSTLISAIRHADIVHFVYFPPLFIFLFVFSIGKLNFWT